MFNSTSKILPYTIPGTLITGVILPRSDKLLFLAEIDQKIARTESQLGHLNNCLSERNTHGGKAFRSRHISLQDQISSASKRIELLQLAKTLLTIQDKQLKIDQILDLPRARSYLEGQQVNTYWAGKMRQLT